jgi:RNA polymerase sigma factor (sigma-70 family)
MYEDNWNFALHWVNVHKRAIHSYITYFLMPNAVMDEDDYIQMAYEAAFDAQLNSIEKGEPEKFKRYFWNILKREIIDFNRLNGGDTVYDDINDVDDFILTANNHKYNIDPSELDSIMKQAFVVMTEQQKIIWQAIEEFGYSSSYDIAEILNMSRQAVNKHLNNSLERVRNANLLANTVNV